MYSMRNVFRYVLIILLGAIWGGFAGYGIVSAYHYWTEVRPFDKCIQSRQPVCYLGSRSVKVIYFS